MSCSTFSVAAGSVLLSAVLLIGPGCASEKQASAEGDMAQCKMVKPGTVTSVNTLCVMVNDDPVDPAVEPVLWKGQKIGFCCKGCIPKWAALTDAQKDAHLAKALAAAKAKG